jgi:hypothetical protein
MIKRVPGRTVGKIHTILGAHALVRWRRHHVGRDMAVGRTIVVQSRPRGQLYWLPRPACLVHGDQLCRAELRSRRSGRDRRCSRRGRQCWLTCLRGRGGPPDVDFLYVLGHVGSNASAQREAHAAARNHILIRFASRHARSNRQRRSRVEFKSKGAPGIATWLLCCLKAAGDMTDGRVKARP